MQEDDVGCAAGREPLGPGAAETRASRGEAPLLNDYECPCCTELLLEPVVAPCGHDMCKACYQKWCKASTTGLPACPLCRAPMPASLGVCLRLKRTVEALHPAASKRRRMEQDACSAAATVSDCHATEAQQCHAGQPAHQHQPSWNAWHTQQLHDFAHFQQVMTLAGMYSQYHHYWAVMQQQQQAAVTGTPVSDLLHPHQQQHQHQQHWHMRTLPGGLAHYTARGVANAAAAQQRPRFVAAATASFASEEGHAAVAVPATSAAGAFVAARGDDDGDDSSSSGASARAAAATSSEVPTVAPSPPQSHSHSALPRWQSVLDVPLRLQCARQILALLRRQAGQGGASTAAAWARLQQPSLTTATTTTTAHNNNSSNRSPAAGGAGEVEGLPGATAVVAEEPALLAVVRSVEVQLYRQAPSRQAYTDAATLQARVAALVRRRLAAARSSRLTSRAPLADGTRLDAAATAAAAGAAAMAPVVVAASRPGAGAEAAVELGAAKAGGEQGAREAGDEEGEVQQPLERSERASSPSRRQLQRAATAWVSA